jgi:4-amino-4-deoxy-L-arabinose transferase-like glycosyltransferase
MKPEPAARRDTVLLLALLLVYFLLMIGARPLNIPDEGRYPEVAREMLQTGDFVTPRNNGIVFLDKPALYYWLQAAAMALFGVEVSSIRLVPALFGAAGCLMTFLAVRRLYSRRAAWLAVMALACQPLYYLSSQYADMNMEVGVWIAASLLAFLLADHSRGRARQGWLLAMYVASGCAFLTKGLIGVVFPLMIVGAWVLVLRRWRELPRYGLAWGLPLVVAINLPWYALVQRANPEFLHYFFVYQQFDRYAATGFNNAQPWWYYPAILAGGLLPWSFLLPAATVHLWRRWRHEGEAGRRHLFLLLWPWLIVLFFCIPESKISSYLLPAIPALAIALGVYMDDLLQRAAWPAWWRLPPYAPVAAGTVALVGVAYWAGPGGARLVAALAGLVWLAGGVLALWQLQQGNPLASWRSTAASVALGMLLLVPLTPHFTQYSSSRALAERMQPALTDDMLIISYRNYLNDLPLYLEPAQRIIVVDHWDDAALATRDNWRREFWLGLQDHPEARRILKLEHELPGLLASGRDFFLIVRRSELAHIQRRFPGLQHWGGFDRVLLFSNRPPPQPARVNAQ